MSEVQRALMRVTTAATRLAAAESEQVAAKRERDEALRKAQAVRATWDEMLQAAGISRPTLATALRRK